ncbi:hypothetical protein FF1_014636 [Malus domestica]
MWLVRRAEARMLCNGMLPRRLRSGVRGRDEIDGDDRNVKAVAVKIRDLDKDDPDRHAISLLAGNLGIVNGEIWAWVEPVGAVAVDLEGFFWQGRNCSRGIVAVDPFGCLRLVVLHCLYLSWRIFQSPNTNPSFP